MSTMSDGSRVESARPGRGLLAELEARQPQLASMSVLFLAAIAPLGLAALLDDRQVNGVDLWLKPIKFLGSFALYYATLAWLHGYLAATVRRSSLGRALVTLPIVFGLLEMVWLVTTAVLGQPSHFNRSAPVYAISYMLAGLGATILMVVVLTMGVLVSRARQVPMEPAFRLAVVLGCGLAFVGTIVTAGYLASGKGHWVGGIPTDVGGLPLVGWSRTGGDLRVAHFFAMHALQVVPFAGWIVTRSGLPRARLAVGALAALYAGLVAWTFTQAVLGRPFL